MKNHANPTGKRFPVYVTEEPTNITIYRETWSGGSRFIVSYYDASCRRQRRRCKTYAQAAELAASVSKQIKQGGWDQLTLRGTERFVYEQSRALLCRTSKPLDAVVREYVEASEILNGRSLVEAAHSFAQRSARQVTPKLVPEIVEELLVEMIQKGRSRFYVRDLRVRLRSFAKKHSCPLDSLTGMDVASYVKSLEGGPRYRNNVLQDIGSLWTFGKAQGYVREDHEGISKVTRYTVKRKDVEVFTPAEMTAMLRKANPQVQLALALTSFAGIRGAELGRLTWADVRFDLGFIRIPAGSSKTGIRRVPPIPDNLRSWLVLHQKASGPVVKYKNVYNQYLKVARRAGVKWKRNAARHGFSSYRTAMIKNLDQVSLEAGHSKTMLMSNYLQVVSESDALAWFSILPTAPNS